MEYMDELVKEMLGGTFSVFCGAGATCDATKQEWQDIFTEKTKKFYRKCSEDIYFLADLEKHYYNSDSFYKDICQKLCLLSNLESEHVNNIVNLNLNQIWTTNFDCIIENTIHRKLGFHPTIIKESLDLFETKFDSDFIVYKLNGSINQYKTMVLTKTDFFNYFKKQRLMFEILKRQLVLDTFLFIGYSFSDDLVLNALREIKEIFPNEGKKHYRFEVRTHNDELKQEYNELVAKYYLDEYNIQTIYVNNFSDIDVYLQKLYARFCNHNVFISGSFRQLKNNSERIYIENIINSLIQKLIGNNFSIYSGNGRGLGEIVVAHVNKNRGKKRFINRPLIFTNDSNEQKREKNKIIMKDCDTMIIVCGQDDELKSSKNVFQQFLTFMNSIENGDFKLVIPIPSTGYAARDIFFSEQFRKSSVYLINQGTFDSLLSTKDPESISEIIINLIKSYKHAIS